MLHRIVLYCVAVGRRTTRSFQQPSPCEFHPTRCCTHELNARSHARTHARVHAHSRTLAHTLARTHARTHACTHLHAYTHTRTHACTHAYTHACTRARSHLFAFAFGRRSSTACAFATEPTCVASWGICNMVRLLHVALSCNQQGELQWIRPNRLARARPTTRGRSQRRCAASTSAPGVGLPLPPLRPCHICIGTGLGPATFAPGLGSPLAHLHRHLAHLSHICTGAGLIPATSAPGLGPPLPHLHRDWAHPCHTVTSAGIRCARKGAKFYAHT